MCGIVGVISKSKAGLFKGHADLFKQMLFVDQLRGTDGTGIIYDDDGKVITRKSPESAGSFLSKEWVKNSIDDSVKTGSFLIGHNRAATKGSLTWQNTHPFTEGHITLVHNGTLFSHKELDDKKEVDSHAICSHMAINGAEETLKNIDGAFALVWINELERTINLARNLERPLHLIECQTCWIISSELGLGMWMADRHNLKVLTAFQLKTETLYTLSLDDLYDLKEKKVDYYKWITYKGNAWGWVGNKGEVDEGTPNFTSRKRKNHPPHKQKASNVIALPAPKSKYAFGEKISFRPKHLIGQNTLSCMIWDEKRMMYFVIGELATDTNVEVRVYGKHKELTPIANAGLLDGTITATVIKGQRISYWVENVNVIMTLSEDDKHMIECDVCGEKTMKKDITYYKGKPLCEICNTAFSDNPQLAGTMGYN